MIGVIEHSHWCAEGDESYSRVALLPLKHGGAGGDHYIPGGIFCSNLFFSSLCVVPDFPSMIFLYLFTTFFASSLPLSPHVLSGWAYLVHPSCSRWYIFCSLLG